MEIRLFNFPLEEERDAARLLELFGHSVVNLTTPDIFETIAADYALPPVLVYSDIPESEGEAIYQLLHYRYPSSALWIVSPSYRPEDVRAAFLYGYANYVLWSPDRQEFREIARQLAEGKWNQRISQSREDFRFRAVSYPLEQQLVTDRLLTALTDMGGSLASSYYPLLYRQEDLQSSYFLVSVIRLHLPLELYLRSDYEAAQNIMVNEMRLHMETVENLLSSSFGILKIVKDEQMICLFYRKSEAGFEKEVLDYLQQVNDRVQSYQGVSLLVGYSHPYPQLADTRFHYGRIVTNLDQGHFYPAQPIHMLDEDRDFISFSKDIDDYIKKNLFIAISNNDCDLIIDTLIEACKMFMEQKVMSTVAKTILLHTLVRFAQETDFYLLVNYEFIERELFVTMLRIVSFPILQDLFALIGDIYAQACKVCAGDDSNRLVLAMQYIQKNYYRKISLESISTYLALTPNYFCGWFKKATGENFGDVVIRYRVDAAKTMLTHSKKKICDIAGEVGYAEIVSFNRVFKKTVGMTPDQYRKAYTEARM